MRACLRALAALPKRGPFTVTVEAGQRYSWCSCGLSSKDPFCDGAHKKNPEKGLKPVRIFPDKSGTLTLCGCRETKTPPFCDGSHNTLPNTVA